MRTAAELQAITGEATVPLRILVEAAQALRALREASYVFSITVADGQDAVEAARTLSQRQSAAAWAEGALDAYLPSDLSTLHENNRAPDAPVR